jgi:uncharacterized membrane protein HdeD (DUF308 family)
MSTETQQPPAGIPPVAESFRSNWFWFVTLGIALIIVGFVAIGVPVFMTLVGMTLFGILLLLGAGVEVASAFFARGWRGVLLHLLAAILYFIVGLLMLTRPLEGAAIITLLLAVFFLVGGLARIVFVLVERFHGWPWGLLNGVITFLLGILIWAQWPGSSLWVIGLFIGLELLFNGLSWVMVGLAVRQLPRAGEPSGPA